MTRHPEAPALVALTDMTPSQALEAVRAQARDGMLSMYRPTPASASEWQAWIAEDVHKQPRAEYINAASGIRTLATLLGQYALISNTESTVPRDQVGAIVETYIKDYAFFTYHSIRKPHVVAGRQGSEDLCTLAVKYASHDNVPLFIVKEAFSRNSADPHGWLLQYLQRIKQANARILPRLNKTYGSAFEPSPKQVRAICVGRAGRYETALAEHYINTRAKKAASLRRTKSPVKLNAEEQLRNAEHAFAMIQQARRNGDFPQTGPASAAELTVLIDYAKEKLFRNTTYEGLDIETAATFVVRNIRRYNRLHSDTPLIDDTEARFTLLTRYLDEVIALKEKGAYEPYKLAAYHTVSIYDNLKELYPNLPPFMYQYAVSRSLRDPTSWIERVLALKIELRDMVAAKTDLPLTDEAALLLAKNTPANPATYVETFIALCHALNERHVGTQGLQTWMVGHAVAADFKNPDRQLRILIKRDMQRKRAATRTST